MSSHISPAAATNGLDVEITAVNLGPVAPVDPLVPVAPRAPVAPIETTLTTPSTISKPLPTIIVPRLEVVAVVATVVTFRNPSWSTFKPSPILIPPMVLVVAVDTLNVTSSLLMNSPNCPTVICFVRLPSATGILVAVVIEPITGRLLMVLI